jgi:hypothetical protein
LDKGNWNTFSVGQSQQTVKWVGAFTGFSMLIGVKAFLEQGNLWSLAYCKREGFIEYWQNHR